MPNSDDMERLRIGIVAREPHAREAAARAFDAAPGSWSVELFERQPEDVDVVVTTPEVTDVEGIRFDPARPDETLEAIRKRTPTASTFVVAGASGGCGCTSLALHLARHLPASIVCELEEGLRHRLGLPGDAVRLKDPEAADDELRMAALPVAGGFRVVLASEAVASDPAAAVARLATIGQPVVVDGGSSVPRSLLAAATAAVLVVPPNRVAAERAREVLSAAPTTRWAVVLNRTGPGGLATPAAIARILDRRIVLTLPCCAPLRDAEDDKRLLGDRWTRWNWGVRRLAGALLRA